MGYVDSMLSSIGSTLLLLLNQLNGREGPLERGGSYQLNNNIITYINLYLLSYDNTRSITLGLIKGGWDWCLDLLMKRESLSMCG